MCAEVAWTRPVLRPPVGLERLDRRLALVALVVALGVWDGVATWIVWEVSGDAERDVLHQICVQSLYWIVWLPTIPLIFELADRLRRRAVPEWLAVLVHGIAATLFGGLHLVGMAWIAWVGWNRAAGVGSLESNIALLLGNFLVYDYAIYGVAVASAFGVRAVRSREAARRAEAEEHQAKLRAEMRASEARLKALRMELNPHFLFNALNDVAALVRTDRGPRAVSMIGALGDLLRTTLDRSDERWVPVGEEIDLLRRYVELERMRFGERLRVDFDVEPEVERAAVPPFLLQPLVENAIRHGAGTPPLRVRIGARRRGGELVLTVADDGAGFEPGAAPGVGLTNLRLRLEELYGSSARLSIVTGGRGTGSRRERRHEAGVDHPGAGVEVRVTLPFHYPPRAASERSSSASKAAARIRSAIPGPDVFEVRATDHPDSRSAASTATPPGPIP